MTVNEVLNQYEDTKIYQISYFGDPGVSQIILLCFDMINKNPKCNLRLYMASNILIELKDGMGIIKHTNNDCHNDADIEEVDLIPTNGPVEEFGNFLITHYNSMTYDEFIKFMSETKNKKPSDNLKNNIN